VGAQYDQVAIRALQMCWTHMGEEVTGARYHLVAPLTVSARNLAEFRVQWSQWRKMPETAAAVTP
jgi:hypothetical protein